MKKLILFAISAVLLIAGAFAATLQITPATNTDTDNFYCAVDSNPDAYLYKWFEGDSLIVSGQSLGAGSTAPGHTYTCRVYLPPTPYTNELFIGELSKTIASTNTPATNVAPTDPTLSLSAGPYYANSAITATASGSTDANGDAVTYQYKYERAGTTIDNDNVLACSGICARGNTITVSARATDGTLSSNWISQTITISNAPPAGMTITYSPSIVYSDSIVTITATATDADLDAITYTYRFYNVNDSSILQDYSSTNTYTLTSSSGNDTLRLFVSASDGTASTINSADVFVNAISTYTYCQTNSSTSPISIVEIVNLEDIENNDFKPLDNFEIKVKVENTADEDKDVYVRAIIVRNNSDIEDTEVYEKIKINNDDEQTVKLNMTLPVDLKEGDYSLYIKAYDDDHSSNCEEVIIPFDIIRESRDIILTDLEFSPSSTVSCGDLMTFSGKLANIGDSDEDKVKISYEDDLKNKGTDEIDDLESGELSSTFDFYVTPKNTTDAKHKITLTVNYDYDEDDEDYNDKSTFTYYFTTKDCKLIASPVSNLTSLNITTTPTKVEEAGFSDFVSGNWKIMIVIAEIIAVMFILLKFFVFKA